MRNFCGYHISEIPHAFINSAIKVYFEEGTTSSTSNISEPNFLLDLLVNGNLRRDNIIFLLSDYSEHINNNIKLFLFKKLQKDDLVKLMYSTKNESLKELIKLVVVSHV